MKFLAWVCQAIDLHFLLVSPQIVDLFFACVPCYHEGSRSTAKAEAEDSESECTEEEISDSESVS